MAELAAADALRGSWGSVISAPPTRRWSLRVDPADRAWAEVTWGCILPAQMLRGSGDATRAALHLEPDEWLLLAADPKAADAFRGDGAPPLSLVEITDRQFGFLVAGAGARDLLAAGVPLDLDDRATPPGTATRTVCGKVEIVLWRLADAPEGPSFRVEVWRSFAPYLIALLRAAAADL